MHRLLNISLTTWHTHLLYMNILFLPDHSSRYHSGK